MENNRTEENWRESVTDNVEEKRGSGGGGVKRRESMRKIKSGVNRMIDTLTRNRFGIDIREKFQRRKFLFMRNVTFQN